eukprot:CAMPEP_0116017126 /NCGR_PEP_ID=MMETSP0321-20121206/7870_1 /TAXON_ID=163516 /ORGANISM="Leptocylindrus danicus var. danicus, Strain B650" /LENGTH=334 /DNA_ID=CAMNT_0003487275 /DNA_START=130 /DNA_END=1134 /DNA_ORIENTATION=+
MNNKIIAHPEAQQSKKHNDEILSTDLLFSEYRRYGIDEVDRSTKIDQVAFARISNAANDGSVQAAYFLGLVYLYGMEPLYSATQINPKPHLAIKWFRFAAEGGHRDAQTALGLLLYNGMGNQLKPNINEAIRWFRKVSNNDDDKQGHWLLGRALYEKANRLNDSELEEEGVLLLLKSVHSNIPESIHYLAVLMEYELLDKFVSKGIISDALNASDLYRKAFDFGYAESGYNLGLMYAYGRQVQQDWTMALDIFRRCATEYFHAPSMRYIGIFYTNGHGLPVNYEQAIVWFERCGMSGDYTVNDLCQKEKEQLQVAIDNAEKLMATEQKVVLSWS